MNYGTGNRDYLKFEYTASKLAEAAQAQKKLRLSRVKVCTEAKAKLMAKVKINVRADLQTKLQECHAKIQAHEQAAAEYDGWVQVLGANPEARLKLALDDWLYFFGKT